MRQRCLVFCLIILAILPPSAASAHKSSDSYLSLDVDGTTIAGQWDIALRDLDYAIGLDSDNDGIITWGELRARQTAIAAYALSNLTVAADGKACAAHPLQHLVDQHSDGAYEVLRFSIECPAAAKTLEIGYGLLFPVDPQHRGLLKLTEHGVTHTTVFSPDQRRWRVDENSGAAAGLAAQFLDYFREGVWHIWTGFDHILFLSALLLPAVLERRSGRWQAVATFREAVVDVLKVVTAFTVAHSITLSLAVLGYIALPSRLVESAIALSVIVAALNNVYPVIEKRLWVVAFIFGLVHGLGFANVLTELGLPAGALAVSLVGFNLGVEAGQLAIVAAVIPLAFGLRRSSLYRPVILAAGSMCIAVMATIWLLERSLDVRILS
jgi:hypothetical protein